MTMKAELREAIYQLSNAIDPDHQSDCWPDPIKWDGRPLQEQLSDLIVLAEAKLDGRQEYQYTTQETHLKNECDAAKLLLEFVEAFEKY